MSQGALPWQPSERGRTQSPSELLLVEGIYNSGDEYDHVSTGSLLRNLCLLPQCDADFIYCPLGIFNCKTLMCFENLMQRLIDCII